MILRKFLTAVLTITIILSIIGCGRKRPPKVPELFAPAQVLQFRAIGSIEGVGLQWQAPQRQANGEPLTDLSRFDVYRAELSEDDDPDFDTLAEIPYVGPQLEEIDEEQKRDSLKGLKIAKKEKQEIVMVNYLDTTTEPGQRYLYYVVPHGGGRMPGVQSPTLLVIFIGEASQVELYVR